MFVILLLNKVQKVWRILPQKGWSLKWDEWLRNITRTFFLMNNWVVWSYGKYLVLWSYASYGAQCGVTTSHSSCCGCCIRDNHIRFRQCALSNSSVPTLCLKDPWGWDWHNSAGSSSDGQVIRVARLSSNSKNRETPLLINNKNGFIETRLWDNK